MYPDKSALYAFNRIYEPLPTVDNKWIVFYMAQDGWRQKMFVERNSAFDWYFQKFNEYKAEYQKTANQRSR